MALNSNALVTLNTTKEFVGVPLSETSMDTLLENFINAASERCERYTNRKFTDTLYTEYRDGSRTIELLLHQWPVTSITELNPDPDRKWLAATALDSSVIQIFQDQNLEGIGVRRTDGAIFPRGPGIIKIQYNAGYTAFAAPSDLQEACKIAVAYWFNKNQNREYSTSTKSKGDEDVSILQGLPADAREILEDYKRLEVPGEAYPVVNK